MAILLEREVNNMKPEFTKLLDLYKGFEGEPGYFFAAMDAEHNFHYYIKVWSGYVDEIFTYEPHMGKNGWEGLTKLIQECVLDDFTYGLDNFYKVDDKQEFLDDLLWYKNNVELKDEALTLLNALIELSKYAIDNNLDLLVANDEDA